MVVILSSSALTFFRIVPPLERPRAPTLWEMNQLRRVTVNRATDGNDRGNVMLYIQLRFAPMSGEDAGSNAE